MTATLSPAAGCEIVDIAWLQARQDAWDDLVANAASPNPFYSRRMVGAHVAHGLAGSGLRFIVVRRGDSLLALLPYRPGGARVGLRRAHAAWTSPYAVESTPLIAKAGLADNAAALLDGLKAAGPLWLFPLLSLEASSGAALRAGIASRRWPQETLSPFGRAVFGEQDKTDFESYLGAKRRRDLRRQRRRLAETGRLDVQSFVKGAGLDRAVADFLALELRGWKGNSGTALASRKNTASFLHAAFAEDGGPVTCRADVMKLDDRPVAITLSFLCGGTAYLFKTAYDEDLARHAPGVLLKEDIVRIWRETGFARGLNSVGAEGNVLEIFFPGREAIGDLLFPTDAKTSPRALVSMARQEALRRRAAASMKSLYWRLRAACHPTSAKGLASVEGK